MSTKHRSSPSGPLAGEKLQTVLLDHGSVVAATVNVASVTVASVRTTDVVRAVNSLQKTGLGFAGARISAAGVVDISLVNPTAGAITTGTVTYTLEIGPYTS